MNTKTVDKVTESDTLFFSKAMESFSSVESLRSVCLCIIMYKVTLYFIDMFYPANYVLFFQPFLCACSVILYFAVLPLVNCKLIFRFGY